MYDDYIICMDPYGNDLIKVPFRSAASGDYPIYEKAKIIKKNCKLDTGYGLMCENSDTYSFTLVEDSHDGFQPVEECIMKPDVALNIITELFKEAYGLK